LATLLAYTLSRRLDAANPDAAMASALSMLKLKSI
jgi:hypothetical protein